MTRIRLHLPGFVVAAWVMTSVIVAIAYALCLGTAESRGAAESQHHPSQLI